MAIRVGRKWEKGAVYIGRPSILGNPYPLRTELDRPLVVQKYREYFERRVQSNNAAFMRALAELERLARSGELVLGCFCAPRACHGDVIKEYLDRKIADG